MSQSTPTAVTKRKVMGRMDTAPAESPSSSVTPNARPRIVRAQHGYSSPSLSSSVTPTATRTAAGTGRARVDMSAFASPHAQSSPAMSPSMSRPASASSSASSTITARLSAPSPSVRPHAPLHTRSGSVVGSSASSYKLQEARIDPPIDPNLASLRSPRIRTRNGSVDLTASPSLASPSSRPPSGSQPFSPIARADPSQLSQLQRPPPPAAPLRPAPALNARQLLSPQRSQGPAEQVNLRASSRSPSPVQAAASTPTLASTSSFHSAMQQYGQNIQGRHTPSTAAMQGPFVGSGSVRSANGSAPPTPDELSTFAVPAAFDSSSDGNSRPEQGSTTSIGRTATRSGSALQRAAIPSALIDAADAIKTPRRSEDARSSFASSTHSAHLASLPLSPTSESPRSPSEAGEAEEARVHRKLLDLEITNRSLLAINSALEVTKLKQAREIRELKRRLREGRGLSFGAVSRDSAGSGVFSDDEALESESDDDAGEFGAKEDPELEAAHQRCKELVDGMVEQARRAILAEYEAPETTGGKVLHPAEVEEMQRVADEADETGADSTFATDAMDRSITFDHSSGDTSQAEDGSPGSPLRLPNGNAHAESSPSSVADDLARTGLPTKQAFPSSGDVSID